MNNVNRQGPLLELAKTQAKELIKLQGNGDKFQIITNDFEGKHQRFHSKEDALTVVDDIKPSSSTRALADVVRRQTDFLNNSELVNKRIYAFSDGQRSTFGMKQLAPDSTVHITLVPLIANQVNNVYLDTCWFETPLQQKGFIQKLHARIVNNGKTAIDVGSARLALNNQQIAIASFSLEPESDTEVLFTFECKQAGVNNGSIKIEDYPITFDDELFFAFNSQVTINVSLINGKDVASPGAFASLFEGDSLFRFSTFSEQTIDYTAFRTSDVLIINQLNELSSGLVSELIKFSEKGGALVLIPSQKAALPSYNAAFSLLQLPALQQLDTVSVKTDKINTAASFYAGVFEKIEERINLPLVNKHFSFAKTSLSDFEPILSLQNNETLLGRKALNNAQVYLFSAPLTESSTNFNKHALFVPTFYQIAFSSLKSWPLFYPVSSNRVISLKNDVRFSKQPPHIRKTDKTVDVIPEIRPVNNRLLLYTQQQITTPGFYEVLHSDELIIPLAFNYSRLESDLECYTLAEINEIISEKGWRNFSTINTAESDLSSQFLEAAEGKKLWKLFIILTLLFVALEITLLRLLK
jgi:hypothetical protein